MILDGYLDVSKHDKNAHAVSFYKKMGFVHKPTDMYPGRFVLS